MDYKNPTKAQIRERLTEVKRRITANPDSYDQAEWCGTACCIAGHLCAVVGRRLGPDEAYIAASVGNDAIGTAFGPWLFNASFSYGPEHIRELARADRQGGGRIRPETACAAIDAYLEEIGA